jgi:hypothetical protein
METEISRERAREGSTMRDLSDGDRPVELRAAPAGDHRGVHRKRTLKQARVILTDWSTLDCTVRDMSEGGARLVFGSAFTLPKEFRLLMVQANTIVPVRLQWQRGTEVGVAFTGPHEAAPSRV